VTRENKASAAHWTAMKLQHGGVGAITRSDPFSCTDRSMDGWMDCRPPGKSKCSIAHNCGLEWRAEDKRTTEGWPRQQIYRDTNTGRLDCPIVGVLESNALRHRRPRQPKYIINAHRFLRRLLFSEVLPPFYDFYAVGNCWWSRRFQEASKYKETGRKYYEK